MLANLDSSGMPPKKRLKLNPTPLPVEVAVKNDFAPFDITFDDVLLHIMQLLDPTHVVELAKTCRRYAVSFVQNLICL